VYAPGEFTGLRGDGKALGLELAHNPARRTTVSWCRRCSFSAFRLSTPHGGDWTCPTSKLLARIICSDLRCSGSGSSWQMI